MTAPFPIDLSAARIGALLNTASGSCDIGAEQEMEAILQAAGFRADRIWCGGGEQVEPALTEIKTEPFDLLIVLGGDGTIRSAAEACGDKGPMLMPLPGGTMNMLPKAVYGETKWQAALASALAHPAQRAVHGGRIGRTQFFVAAILGNPSLFAESREAARHGDLGSSLTQGIAALQKSFRNDLRYRFDDAEGSAEAVSVLCPLTSHALGDEERFLEAAVITSRGAVDAFSLALRAAFNDWRADPNVTTAKVKRVLVESDDKIPAILDGETIELGSSATVAFVPNAFQALVPADAPTS